MHFIGRVVGDRRGRNEAKDDGLTLKRPDHANRHQDRGQASLSLVVPVPEVDGAGGGEEVAEEGDAS